MKPKPLASLNHLTVPVAIFEFLSAKALLLRLPGTTPDEVGQTRGYNQTTESFEYN
jgi:hypothetical protein